MDPFWTGLLMGTGIGAIGAFFGSVMFYFVIDARDMLADSRAQRWANL